MAENPAKRQKLAGEQSDPRTEAEQLQNQIEELNEQASEKVIEIEQEFNRKRRPLYEARNRAYARLPTFWRMALEKHHTIYDVLDVGDKQILNEVTELNVVENDDIKSGYKIVLRFQENPYIEEEELSRQINVNDDGSCTVECSPLTYKQPVPDVNFIAWFATPQPTPVDHDLFSDAIKDEVWPDPMRWYNAEMPSASTFEAEFDEGESGDDEGFADEGEDEYEGADPDALDAYGEGEYDDGDDEGEE